jgi:hypothetical protein
VSTARDGDDREQHAENHLAISACEKQNL